MPIIGYKDIRKDCPRCGCSKDKIEYWNCGPIVYICCPNCRYRLDESIDTPIGIDKLFLPGMANYGNTSLLIMKSFMYTQDAVNMLKMLRMRYMLKRL